MTASWVGMVVERLERALSASGIVKQQHGSLLRREALHKLTHVGPVADFSSLLRSAR